jgi:hypothetical protein
MKKIKFALMLTGLLLIAKSSLATCIVERGEDKALYCTASVLRCNEILNSFNMLSLNPSDFICINSSTVRKDFAITESQSNKNIKFIMGQQVTGPDGFMLNNIPNVVRNINESIKAGSSRVHLIVLNFYMRKNPALIYPNY